MRNDENLIVLRERERESSNLKNTKGVTLIALVITIIVLLILAGVTIQTLTGDNGLLQKAQTAKEENEKAKELELIKLAVASAKLAGKGTITKDNLESELKSNFGANKEVLENNTFFYCNGYRIYKDGKVEEGNLLPDEYQQVEYIESTGTQWIDTNQKLPFSINILAKLTSTDNIETLIGCQNSGMPWIASYIRTGKWGNFNFLSGTPIQFNSDDNIHSYIAHFHKNNAIINIDDEPYGNVIIENDYLPYTMYFFAMNAGGQPTAFSNHFQIYECKIYSDSENTNLIRNFIPCKSTTTVTNADGNQVPANTKGMYDTVEGKFYTNQGTGEFIAGPEV